MTKSLIIAEKPSVAQDIVRALTPESGKFEKQAEYFENEQYVVTSAVGHLVEIAAPEEYDVKRGKWSFTHLPVVPPHFDLAPIDKTKTRLNAVVRLLKRKDVSNVINACDAGREGELIFRLIQQYAKAKQPVKRLWLQSMTPQAIRDGFSHLRGDGEMQGLADAARSRSEADWLVGINGTRAMTAFNSRDGGFFLTTVGRVQTPTLSIVVEREEKIRKHVARDYWEVKATFGAAAGAYDGKWFDPKFKRGDDAEDRADRIWAKPDAQAIVDACRGQTGTVTEEAKPSTQASPLLYDLTSLQREANGRFGYSAKTTLALAQSLYERHKALTYPRTDSRALPEDYLATVKQTVQMLAKEALPPGMKDINGHAARALKEGYVKPTKRVFDNTKVSDHFAIIPTLQVPHGLSEAEAKLYDMVVKRFLAVFYPSAEYMVTTRITKVEAKGAPEPLPPRSLRSLPPEGAGPPWERPGGGPTTHHFQTNGKVLVNPGWLAVYGKEAQDADATLVPVTPNETVRVDQVDAIALRTKPPPRYSEATLLSAMEGAGKLIDDDELREAMQEKGLGTPATRAAIIEGLINEKYMLREGRELIATAKAFQLLTLLRGLEVEELTKPELTGDWEYRLAQMEHGKLSRDAFMSDVARLAERIVKKAKEYDRDTIPGDYAILDAPCPKCGGIVQENYRRYACTGKPGEASCGFSITKIPAGRAFEIEEVELFLVAKRIGPLDGFRSKKGFPFAAELRLVEDAETDNWKLEFDFGEDERQAAESGEPVDFGEQDPLGACPKCGGKVFEHGTSYVCEKSTGPARSCDFKSGKIILQQPVAREQMTKLLAEGKTDQLENFVSNKTRRKFKARLAFDAKEGKVIFEFEPRKFPPRKGAAGAAADGAAGAAQAAQAAQAAVTKAAKSSAKKAPSAKSPAAKKAAPAAKSTAARKAR